MIWRSDDRFGYPSWCDLEMRERPDGKRVFIASELVVNPGRCVTNDPVKLANEVRRHFAMKAKDMIWIEHYPRRQHCGASDDWLAECFEWLRFSINRRGEFTAYTIRSHPNKSMRSSPEDFRCRMHDPELSDPGRSLRARCEERRLRRHRCEEKLRATPWPPPH
jgi:hypothetical protein